MKLIVLSIDESKLKAGEPLQNGWPRLGIEIVADARPAVGDRWIAAYAHERIRWSDFVESHSQPCIGAMTEFVDAIRRYEAGDVRPMELPIAVCVNIAFQSELEHSLLACNIKPAFVIHAPGRINIPEQ